MFPRNERLSHTSDELEDEIHFLIECDKHNNRFKTLTEEASNVELTSDSWTKFIFNYI